MAPAGIKAPKSETRASLLERLTRDSQQVYEFAEEILKEVADATQVNSEQWVVLRAVGVLTDKDLEKAMGRIQGVKGAMQAAGTAAQYAAAKESAAQARAAADAELPGLREAVARAEARMAELEAAVERTTHDVEVRETHRDLLRERHMLPPWIARDRDLRRSRVQKRFSEVGELKHQVDVLEYALQLAPGDSQEGTLAKSLGFASFLDEEYAARLRPGAQQAYRDEVERMLGEKRAALEPLRQEYEAELAAIDEDLSNFYVRQL